MNNESLVNSIQFQGMNVEIQIPWTSLLYLLARPEPGKAAKVLMNLGYNTACYCSQSRLGAFQLTSRSNPPYSLVILHSTHTCLSVQLSKSYSCQHFCYMSSSIVNRIILESRQNDTQLVSYVAVDLSNSMGQMSR